MKDSALPWRADVRLTEEDVRLLASSILGSCERVVPLGEGWDFITYRVNSAHVLRVPKRAACEPVLEREQRVLDLLQAADLPVLTPIFTHLARTDRFPWQVAIYEFVPGTPLSDVGDQKVRLGVPEQLGGFLARLHAFDPGERLPDPWDEDEDDDDWQQREYAAASGAYPAELGRRIEAYLASEAPAEPAVPHVLTHADLGEEHILVDPDSGEVTGVIDWADAFTGCRSRDYLGLYFAGGRDYAERAFAAAGVRPTAGEWQWLAHESIGIGIGHVFYGFRGEQPSIMKDGLEKLPQLLGDIGL